MKCKEFLENPIFQSARQEIEALGFRFSDVSLPDTIPYAVIGGRSNVRWWLVPLINHKVTISGMALFQPVITSARLRKMAAIATCGIGLTCLWARNKIFISRKSCLTDIFGDNNLCYAFFTGTDSPHRKVAVQIMNENGVIKGFAKVSCQEFVKPLLTHESKTLNHLHSLNLQNALIPKVLFYGDIAGADMLVTDTRKTEQTKTEIELNKLHIAFLRELAEKTSLSGSNGTDWFVKALYRRYETVAERLPAEWQRRLKKTVAVLTGCGKDWGPRSLSHGDFTPWNTFFVDGKLYVFDWEYANQDFPTGYDLIHFILSHPDVKRLSACNTIAKINKVLQKLGITDNHKITSLLLLSYLCGHSLHYSSRQIEVDGHVTTWDGEPEAASLIDILLDGT